MKKGFTLVELSIVLIIIGLILGMVLKGRQLIESAKVQNLLGQYYKIHAAVNIFYTRYGFYPGDGCTVPNPVNVSACNGTKNGVIDNTNEYLAFWHLLINVTHILSLADRRSIFGTQWHLFYETNRGRTGTWLYFLAANSPPYPPAHVPVQYICQLDQLIDDGEATTGDIVDKTGDPYSPGDDCWSLSGTTNVRIYLMP